MSSRLGGPMAADSAAHLIKLVTEARDGDAAVRQTAVAGFDPNQIDDLLHGAADLGGAALASGIGASPGAASGQAYFSADAAMDAFDRGEMVVLVCLETSPADEGAMRVVEGIVTGRGGLASHAAVVARGWGIPAVCGAESLEFGDDGSVSAGGVQLVEGSDVSLDGATGEIFLGAAEVSSGGPPAELDELLSWADEICAATVTVRANADSGDDAARARSMGAQGIGLCRTEHQFLGERATLVQRFVVDEDDSALDAMFDHQRADFIEVLEAMDGLPVTVRFLDAPLHEFLHGLSGPAADKFHEANPMLGFRGVRLGILRPALYAMQARALAEAVKKRRSDGGDPHAEIMIPLVGTTTELQHATETVLEAWATVLDTPPVVGTMIETPRAALVAGSLAETAGFLSFGTNDLTQLTFGFSRDDLEASVISPYVDQGVLPSSPFGSLDLEGVGALVSLAVESSRAVDPDLKIGVCGEHGGDPDSVRFFVQAGLNYVSCSPFRVPAARLAAAQAVLSLNE